MSSIYNSKSENKFKKLRNKDSYMTAFLERRKKAADFAITDKNKSEYGYKAPLYIMKSGEDIIELKKKKQNQINSDRNKIEFYKTYNTLKNSITHKNYKTSNNSSLNKVYIEKENNKYYLSQEKKLENKKMKENKQNLVMLNSYNNGSNKKYNNITHHTIKVTSDSKINEEEKNFLGRNYSWKDLQIQKTSSLNNYDFVDDNNKKEKEIEISSEPILERNNKYDYEEYLYNKHKNDKYISIKRESEINEIINKYRNKNIYNEDYNNEFSMNKNKLTINNNNDILIQNKELKSNYYPKNMSEPHNLFEKTKNIYSLKETKSSYYIPNNISNTHHKSKMSDISPIRINYPNEINNKNLERKYENQALNSNGINKYENNTQLRYNLNLVKDNNDNNNYTNYKDDIQNKNNQDLNKGSYIIQKNSNKYENKLENDFKRKMKNVGILYDNEKYYIDDLEIPKLTDDYYNKNSQKNINSLNDNKIPDNNCLDKKMNNEDKLSIQKNKENDNLKSTDSIKENDLMKEPGLFSKEHKSEKINNNKKFNSNIPQEKNNNNNKIKNVKAQSYKKLPEDHNYESIKEKFESFLKPKEDKEPNIQSKIINSLLSSKEDMNNNNIIGNNNKSLVKNIQEKIKILKENKNKIQNGKDYNYINEIDEYYNKIKSKEEKDNLTLEKYYTELQQKEIQNENNDLVRVNNDNKNYKNDEKENSIKNDNKKKKFIQKSKRLEYIMRNILNNKKYNYVDYHYFSNKMNKSKSKNKKNLDINYNKYLGISAPDINLIADQSNDEYIKIIDENELYKFRNKNLRSVRINYNIGKNDINNKISNYRNKSSTKIENNYSNYYKYFSPKLIIKDITHKIMPPNEL